MPTASPQAPAPSTSAWSDMDNISALGFKVEQLRALANAMYCVAYIDGDDGIRNYFDHRRDSSQSDAVETVAPLSLLSQRLCDEVEAHVHALSDALRAHEAAAQAELTDILEKRTHLDPEGQTLLDEIAHILSVATPAEAALLALGVEGVKQKAQQEKAARAASKQGENETNGSR